ncbi:DUF397 domain-containing protein [Streptomyces sp. JJ66]|uniref:DUF397 domain-containing protein n=1 Tax=Streptomyces sp. JJ66 TaxID=2803843 RepID=UPI001C577CB4|nr:DUF397 domain-containing protein [Streptomyces sp. JJ66]MBW1602677.1 DUF397 domain-containing protein [Streptomyces sp. JJ66]
MDTSHFDLSQAPWRKSSYSPNNDSACVEVADGYIGVVPVRDSKNPGGPTLVVGNDAWHAFVGYATAHHG